jgi:hypothetical protein
VLRWPRKGLQGVGGGVWVGRGREGTFLTAIAAAPLMMVKVYNRTGGGWRFMKSPERGEQKETRDATKGRDREAHEAPRRGERSAACIGPQTGGGDITLNNSKRV